MSTSSKPHPLDFTLAAFAIGCGGPAGGPEAGYASGKVTMADGTPVTFTHEPAPAPEDPGRCPGVPATGGTRARA